MHTLAGNGLASFPFLLSLPTPFIKITAIEKHYILMQFFLLSPTLVREKEKEGEREDPLTPNPWNTSLIWFPWCLKSGCNCLDLLLNIHQSVVLKQLITFLLFQSTTVSALEFNHLLKLAAGLAQDVFLWGNGVTIQSFVHCALQASNMGREKRFLKRIICFLLPETSLSVSISQKRKSAEVLQKNISALGL